MTNEELFRKALEAIRDANLDDCCPPRSLQEVAAGALRRAAYQPSAACCRDAARYRWLREADPMCPGIEPELVPTLQGHELDAAIDVVLRLPVEPEGSRRGIEVMATHAQQAWYHVGQLAIVRPEMTVEKAVQEVYKLCTGESSPERCGCGEFIERRCGVCGEPWLPVNRGAEPDVR